MNLKYELVNSKEELKHLSKIGKIGIWPVPTNNSKNIPFLYVQENPEIKDEFDYNGYTYKMKYHSGCFYPFLYKALLED